MPDASRIVERARAFPVSDTRQDPPADMVNGRGVPQGSRLWLKKQVKEKEKEWKFRVGTWNVGTLTGKLREIADVMERRRIGVLCMQETRWKGKGAREVGNGFKLYYCGAQLGRNGVGVIVSSALKDKVVEVKRVSDRMIVVVMLFGECIVHIVSAYSPQMGCNEEEKDLFREKLEAVIRTVKDGERIIIGADMNGRVGMRRDGYEEVHGGHVMDLVKEMKTEKMYWKWHRV